MNQRAFSQFYLVADSGIKLVEGQAVDYGLASAPNPSGQFCTDLIRKDLQIPSR